MFQFKTPKTAEPNEGTGCGRQRQRQRLQRQRLCLSTGKKGRNARKEGVKEGKGEGKEGCPCAAAGQVLTSLIATIHCSAYAGIPSPTPTPTPTPTLAH